MSKQPAPFCVRRLEIATASRSVALRVETEGLLCHVDRRVTFYFGHNYLWYIYQQFLITTKLLKIINVTTNMVRTDSRC